ncbi:MAG: hypothetical protein IPL38_11770 [Rhodobacter sp.]|nr:hypothetical protein [Rhodobacter sp.]
MWVALSGGSDSMALLHLLARGRRADPVAVTVDHRLRPESGRGRSRGPLVPGLGRAA